MSATAHSTTRPLPGVDTAATKVEPVVAADAGTRRRRRWPRRLLLLAVLAGGAALATSLLVGGDNDSPTTVASAPTATAEVSRRDLVVTESYDATVDYADTRSVVNRLAGTVTWTNAAGVVVDRGQSFYSVDGVPVVLFIGEVPAYRELSTEADSGADIRQLEENLVALGYATAETMTVDEEFDSDTEDAVEAWEEALAVEADGIVQLGQVVFLPGAVRIDEIATEVGGSAGDGSEIVNVTATSQNITLALDSGAADDVAVGEVLSVELPDGTETTATVASMAASTATESDGQTATEEQSTEEETVEVVLTLDDPAAATAWDSATVEVAVVSDEAEGVLAVPVTALVTLAEGGYAVQVVDPSAPAGYRYVAVEPGLYADNFVEITGQGIEAGALVVVPE